MRLNKRKLITCHRQDDVTADMVKKAIGLHRSRLLKNYLENEKMYMSDHDILHAKKKESYKPDNRLVLNYAKYIIDTFSGYHIGIPCKVKHDDEETTAFVDEFRRLNDMEDSEFELAKLSSVFGHSFIYLYQDEEGQTRMTYESPTNMLLVYDDTVQELPYFAVRYSLDDETSTGFGELITEKYKQPFTFNAAGDVTLGEIENHIFSGLPVIELIENNERQGLFDSIKTLINALNKVVSEKANDVDYFADAYLKIIGIKLDKDIASAVRDNRIINLYAQGGNGDKVPLDAGFLEKPNADETQENLIKLLIDNIFTLSMVSNISDDDFGNSSGVALAYKLQPMDNLAKTKDRKMKSALLQMYKLVFSVPKASVNSEAYLDLMFMFTRNIPKNLAEEATIAKTLEGQVSKQTQLSVLSIIDNITDELERLVQEDSEPSRLSNRLKGNEDGE